MSGGKVSHSVLRGVSDEDAASASGCVGIRCGWCGGDSWLGAGFALPDELPGFAAIESLRRPFVVEPVWGGQSVSLERYAEPVQRLRESLQRSIVVEPVCDSDPAVVRQWRELPWSLGRQPVFVRVDLESVRSVREPLFIGEHQEPVRCGQSVQEADLRVSRSLSRRSSIRMCSFVRGPTEIRRGRGFR